MDTNEVEEKLVGEIAVQIIEEKVKSDDIVALQVKDGRITISTNG